MISYVDAERQATKPTRDSVLADIKAGRRSAVAEAALLSYSDMIGLGLTSAPAAFDKFYREAGPRPARTASTPATVTDAGRARVREIRARVNAADAKAALIEEINRKHGHAAARAAQDLSIDKLIGRAAAPTRGAISASWDRAFKLKGIAIHEDDPNETPIQQSWTRAFRRCGANIESNVARPAETDKHGWSKAMARNGASL